MTSCAKRMNTLSFLLRILVRLRVCGMYGCQATFQTTSYTYTRYNMFYMYNVHIQKHVDTWMFVNLYFFLSNTCGALARHGDKILHHVTPHISASKASWYFPSCFATITHCFGLALPSKFGYKSHVTTRCCWICVGVVAIPLLHAQADQNYVQVLGTKKLYSGCKVLRPLAASSPGLTFQSTIQWWIYWNEPQLGSEPTPSAPPLRRPSASRWCPRRIERPTWNRLTLTAPKRCQTLQNHCPTFMCFRLGPVIFFGGDVRLSWGPSINTRQAVNPSKTKTASHSPHGMARWITFQLQAKPR